MSDAGQKVGGEHPKEGVFQGVGGDGTEHTCFVSCNKPVMEEVKRVSAVKEVLLFRREGYTAEGGNAGCSPRSIHCSVAYSLKYRTQWLSRSTVL